MIRPSPPSLLRELQVGIPVTDEAGQRLGHSVTAAKQGIFQVVISRICMAIPAMGEAGVAGWGLGGSQRTWVQFFRGFEDSGAISLQRGLGGTVKGESPPLGTQLSHH